MGLKGCLIAVVALCVLSSGVVSLHGGEDGALPLLPLIGVGPRDERNDDPPAPATPFDVPTLAEGNIARRGDVIPFGSRSINPSKEHDVLNDGLYGFQSQWRGNGGTASTQPGGALESCGAVHCVNPQVVGGGLECAYAGLYWVDGDVTVAEIAIGSNNQRQYFAVDITQRNFVVQYTTDAFTPVPLMNDCLGDNPPCDDSSQVAPTVTWVSLGIANAHLRGRGSTKTFRHRYKIDPPLTGVRGIRVLKVENADIDEIEVGNVPNALGPEPATALVLKETGGPYATPAASGDVPSVGESNLARHADAVAFASSAAGVENLNDGSYGTAWVGADGATSGITYAGIYFDEVELPDLQEIGEIAISRDNTGVLNNLTGGEHTIEITTDTFDPADDASVAGASWTRPLQHVAEAHLRAGASCQGRRHRYAFLLREEVRAIRVVTAAGNGFDEIEVGPVIAADLDVALTALGGITFLGMNDTPSGVFAPGKGAGNVARADDAVGFASLSVFTAHSDTRPVKARDGFYGDGNGWNGHPSVVTVPRSFASYIGVYWTDGFKRIDEIRESRDNTGGHANRHEGAFAIHYTTDELEFEFGGEDEPSVARARWIPVGTMREHYTVDGLPDPTAEVPEPKFEDLLQHLYELDPPIVARGIRVSSWPLSATGPTHFDEIVLMGEAVGIPQDLFTCGAPSGGPEQIAGDCNQDGGLDLSDVIHFLGFLFQGSPESLPCSTEAANLALMDINNDGGTDLSDAIYGLAFLFQGGSPPVAGTECFNILDCPANPGCQ